MLLWMANETGLRTFWPYFDGAGFVDAVVGMDIWLVVQAPLEWLL